MSIYLPGLNPQKSPSLETPWINIFSILNYVQPWVFQSYEWKILFLSSLFLFIVVCRGCARVWVCLTLILCGCQRTTCESGFLPSILSQRTVCHCLCFLVCSMMSDPQASGQFSCLYSPSLLRGFWDYRLCHDIRLRLKWKILLFPETLIWSWVNIS